MGNRPKNIYILHCLPRNIPAFHLHSFTAEMLRKEGGREGLGGICSTLESFLSPNRRPKRMRTLGTRLGVRGEARLRSGIIVCKMIVNNFPNEGASFDALAFLYCILIHPCKPTCVFKSLR